MSEKVQIKIDDAREIAKGHHRTGNLSMAERAYKDILSSIPDDFYSLHYLSVVLYQQGNINDALIYAEKAYNIQDDFPESLNAYAVMLAANGQKEEAITRWKKAVKIRSPYPEAYSNLSHAYWELEDYENALNSGLKATQEDSFFLGGLINLGNAYAGMKKYDEAIAAWKKYLEHDPKNADAYINIGNALRDAGRIKESEDYCEKAVEYGPTKDKAYLNLANAKFDLAKYDEAEENYRKTIALSPDKVDAHTNLALTLMALLRYPEAVTSLKFAIALDPNKSRSYTCLASALIETSMLEDAEAAGRKALALNPDSVSARINLADILFLSDRYEDAESLLNEVMEMSAETPHIYMKLSAVLERIQNIPAAIEAIDKAIELSPNMPEVYHRKAQIYFISNQIEKALEQIDKALEMKNNFLPALATKSDILQSMGKMEEAEEITRQGLAINNNIPSLHFILSKVKKLKKGEEDYENLMAMIERFPNLGRVQEISKHFALSKVHEDNKDYEKAFENLKTANDLKRDSVVLQNKGQDAVIEKIKKTFTKDNIQKFSGKGCKETSSIFIVGMPRSGTTLTEQIISSHPKVFGAGELSYITQAEQKFTSLSPDNAADMGQEYVNMTRAISDEAAASPFITDKMPANYAKLGQIFATLPNAKIIHTRRNPVDTCLSCYKQLFARGQYWSYNFEDMVEHYTHYMKLMAHWRKEFPDRFIEVNYEDTVGDFENQARKLIDYVGLEWDDACLSPHKNKRAILTASKAQVIQPVYKTSVEGWRRYEEQLQPLADMLDKFVGDDKKQKDL